MIAFRTFFRSLRHATRGIVQVARTEHSFRVQLLAAVAVIALSIILPLATWERILLYLMTAAVLVLEIINSITERLADALQPRLSAMVKEVKDMMAGAVLVAAVTTAIVGILIFWPHVKTILVQLGVML